MRNNGFNAIEFAKYMPKMVLAQRMLRRCKKKTPEKNVCDFGKSHQQLYELKFFHLKHSL